MALRHVLLGLLASRPSHPYELKRRLSPGVPRERLLNDGVLYPLLARLEREGLVEKREHTAETGRTRHVFSATAEGRKDFLTWLRDPDADSDELGHDFLVRHPFVKLLFLDELEPEQRRMQLDAAVRRTSDALAALERLREEPSSDADTVAGRALLDLLVTQRQAEREWLLDLRATIGDANHDGRPRTPR